MTTTRYPYTVVQPIQRGPEALTTATVISRHRTREAAWQEIQRKTRILRKRRGYQDSWLDWHIREEG